MKKILMIGTGGTIAAEMTGAGLVPELSTGEFLKYVPAVREICDVECEQVCNIDSTNMTPSHWLDIARAVRERYNDYDGFVVCHGTDTMAYTAAALSYLCQGLRKPVIITGSQKPISMEITDSKTNLLDSFACACCERLCGVLIVFGGKIIVGTRARKNYSKSFDAFSSINFPVLGIVQDGVPTIYFTPPCEEAECFFDALDTDVSLLKLTPGCEPSLLEYMLSRSRAVVIESYGVGGVPSGADGEFYRLIERAISERKTVVMTTQVQNEGSDIAVYNVGSRLKSHLSVLEAYDMTIESVMTKLMWILALTDDPERIREMFYKKISSDILCSH